MKFFGTDRFSERPIQLRLRLLPVNQEVAAHGPQAIEVWAGQERDRHLDVVDLEVGQGVLGLDGRPPEHRQLARLSALVADRDRRLPEEGQPERVAVERLRTVQIGHGDRRYDHRRGEHRRRRSCHRTE